MPDRPRFEDVPEDATTRDVLFEVRTGAYDITSKIDEHAADAAPDLAWVRRVRPVLNAILVAIPVALVALGVYVTAATP